jgi:hypothetical protein
MMNEQQKTQIAEEISIKEIIQKLQVTASYLWGYRLNLLLAGLLGGLLGFIYAHFFKEVTYTSRLTFAVEEKSGGGVGNLAGIASQFGFDLGGGGGGLFTSDNLVLLLRSENIIESSLLTPLPELNNNHLLNAYLQKHFEKKLAKGKLHLIPAEKSRDNYSRLEDSTLLLVVKRVQKATMVSRLDKKASIIDLQITDANEQWAYLMSLQLIEKAKSMYMELKTGKTARTLLVLETRVDSVKSALDGLMSAAALETDQNQALVRMQARVPAVKKQMQIQMLTAMYGELVKNLELTRFTLEREEPVIQIIDAPNMPLKRTSQKRLIAAIMGGFLFTVLASVWTLGKQWWQKLG